MNLICFKHPEYTGTTTPTLSCKTCCGLFIAAVKAKTPVKVDPSDWVSEKTREVREVREVAKRVHASYGFDPRTV